MARFESVTQQQMQTEAKLAIEVASLAGVVHDTRDLLLRKLDDHKLVLQHEERIKAPEQRQN